MRFALLAAWLIGCSSEPVEAVADVADVAALEGGETNAGSDSTTDSEPVADSAPRPDTGSDSDSSAPTTADPSWPCGSSSYMGKQFWTCAGAAIHKCEGASPVRIDCEHGCVVGPPGTDDACNKTAPPPLAMPALEIIINGGLFAESAVRKPLEDGLRYELDRMQKLVALDGKKPPAKITITYSPATTAYCTGIAYSASTNVDCPRSYPITGDNQNFVVNISIHEIGHILAQHLIASPSVRDTCTNEGVASWIAGKYGMNAASKPVASLRAAAQYEISLGKASATMTGCVLASDAWYKVYASYYEYLELFVPDGVRSIAAGGNKLTHEAAWQAWMKK